jgi:MFS family permease
MKTPRTRLVLSLYLAANLTQLICFRVIQAICGSMVFRISGAILFLAFPEEERGRAMGYLGSTVAVGSTFGPIIGGFLVDTLGWEYIFFINIPIGIVLVTCALVFLKIPETRSTAFTMDWVGAGTLLAPLLKHSGFQGSIVDADPGLLANVIGNVFFASSLLCLLTMFLLTGKIEGSFRGKSQQM